MIRQPLNLKWVGGVVLLLFAATLFIPSTIRSDETVTETPGVDFDGTLTATSTPLPTETETSTASPTSTATFTETASATPPLTETPIPTETAIATEPFNIPTETLISDTIVTIEATETPFANEVTEIPTTTEGSVTPTSETTDAPEITETTMITATASETATGTLIPMIAHTGAAHYQSHQPDDSGIQITITDANENVLTTTQTDANGAYTILTSSTEFFWLIVSAPLHRRFELGIWPGETLPDVVLLGGDLDGDGCVGAADLALLTAQFGLNDAPTSDITGDGITEAADLAVLAGNYDPRLCMPDVEVAPTEAPGIPTVSVTNELLTPTTEITEIATVAPEITEEG